MRNSREAPKVGFGLSLTGGCLIVVLAIITLAGWAAIIIPVKEWLPAQEFAEPSPEIYKNKTMTVEKELEKLKIKGTHGLALLLKEYVEKIVIEGSHGIAIGATKGYGSKRILNSQKYSHYGWSFWFSFWRISDS